MSDSSIDGRRMMLRDWWRQVQAQPFSHMVWGTAGFLCGIVIANYIGLWLRG